MAFVKIFVSRSKIKTTTTKQKQNKKNPKQKSLYKCVLIRYVVVLRES